MHDAVTAELAGTPAVGIMTEPFVDAAQLMAGILGVPDYKFVTIGHPIANATEDQFQAWAAQAVTEGVELLTRA